MHAQSSSDIFTEDDRAIFLMEEVSRAARRAFDEQVQPRGLNRTQWRVLAELIKDPLATQSDIARRLDLESATVGLAVSALVDGGYVRRQRGEIDRRAWQLKVSDQVEAILPSLRRAADLTHERLWDGISGQEKTQLMQLLARMSKNMRPETGAEVMLARRP